MKKKHILISILLILTACGPNNNIQPITPGSITSSPEQVTHSPKGTPSPRRSIMDGGFLSGNPCDAPCFYGITPGITTEEEATTIIEQNQVLFGGCTFHDETQTGKLPWFGCDHVLISFEQGLVNYVNFHPTQTIILQQVIDKYGQPDLFCVSYMGYPEDTATVIGEFIYEKTNLRLLTLGYDGFSIELNEVTQIEVITYYSDTEFERYIKFDESSLLPWDGYGVYEVTEP